jgi:DNA adenine methylase
VRSFLTYFGGKSRLASTIVERIPEHTCYCEVFAGAAWVLFAKPEETSKSEIIVSIRPSASCTHWRERVVC